MDRIDIDLKGSVSGLVELNDSLQLITIVIRESFYGIKQRPRHGLDVKSSSIAETRDLHSLRISFPFKDGLNS
ncbi:hypothetical protein D3C80_1369380 [compost metagenome]